LVAADVGEALNLPRHHRGESIAWMHVARPISDGNRLPRLVPRERAGRNGRSGGSDVRAQTEQSVESLEKLHLPPLRLGDRKLRESGIRIDKDFVWNARVLVAPEP